MSSATTDGATAASGKSAGAVGGAAADPTTISVGFSPHSSRSHRHFLDPESSADGLWEAREKRDCIIRELMDTCLLESVDEDVERVESIPTVGSDTALSSSMFISCRFPMSKTRSAGMLEAMQVALPPLCLARSSPHGIFAEQALRWGKRPHFFWRSAAKIEQMPLPFFDLRLW